MPRKSEIVALLCLLIWLAAMGDAFFDWAVSRPPEVLAPMRGMGP